MAVQDAKVRYETDPAGDGSQADKKQDRGRKSGTRRRTAQSADLVGGLSEQ